MAGTDGRHAQGGDPTQAQGGDPPRRDREGTVVSPDSWLAKGIQRMAGAAWFARLGPHVVPPMDRALLKVTRGKASFSGLAVPTIELTTTGARSGLPRPAPLAALPDDDGSFLVVGSNFGRERHPAWSGNLLKEPAATVTFRGATFPVHAQLLEGDEKAAAWAKLRVVWPTYDRYAARVTRELRVFRLTRA